MESYKSPPSWALRVLQSVCPPDLIEEIEGDLYEAFQWRIEKKGINYARRHYITEVLRNLRYLRVKLPFTQNIGFMLLKNYFKTGFRFLWKTKGYSALNIIGLATGIAVCWLSYIFVSDEYSYDQFYPNSGELYRITATMSFGDEVEKFAGSSYIMGEEFPNQVPGIKAASRFKSGYALLKVGEETFGQSIRYADPAFFDMFSIEFEVGNAGDFTTPNTTVIDGSTAERLGITDIDGTQEIELTFGSQITRFQVTGIFKDIPVNSSLRPRIIVPFNFWKTIVREGRLTTWYDINMNTFFQLEESASVASISEGMTKVLKANNEDDETEVSLGLQALSNIHMNQDLETGNGIGGRADGQLVTTVTIVGLLCLIIACLNYSNFAIGNYLTRLREVAVRKVFGAKKKFVFQQFVSETFISVFIAVLLSIAIMALILPSFAEFANKRYTLDTVFGTEFITGGIILMILVTVLAGVYPALVISRYTILSSLNGKDKKGGKGVFAKALIVVQFAMAVFLITGMLTINKQLNYMINFDTGYNDENIVTMIYPLSDQTEIIKFKNDLKKIPSIESVTFSSSYNGTDLRLDENTSIDVRHARVDADFLSTLKISVLDGRDFDVNQPSDFSSKIIINQALVDKLGLENPVGQRIPFDYGDVQNPMIIGVVPNYHYESLHSEVEPMLMYMSPEYVMQVHMIKVNKYDPAVIDQIEAVWKRNFAPNPFEFSMLEDDNNAEYELEASIRNISQAGALIAVVLSCLGLMGVVGTQVRRRLKEVSIRKVVGAAPSDILALFSARFIGLVFIGFTIGLVLTYFLIDAWLEEYTNRIDFSWDIGALAVVITFVVSAATIVSQLYKAIHLNPVTYLKEE
jgi:putative ABC transport system permease protein